MQQESGIRYTDRLDSNLRQNQQLGMNRRTASHRLNLMILVSLLYETGRCTCLRCGVPLATDNVSVEHIEEWLDSNDPVDRFFSLENIEFVCRSCNSVYHRKPSEMRDPKLRKSKPIVREVIPLIIPHKPLESRRNERCSTHSSNVPVRSPSVGIDIPSNVPTIPSSMQRFRDWCKNLFSGTGSATS